MRLPIRVAGIILKDKKILLMHRIKNGAEYWVFPGGGLEDTDANEQAGLLREIQEETCLEIEIGKLLYTHDYGTNKGKYYLCNYISGEAMLGDSIEKEQMLKGADNFYEPQWIDVTQIANFLVYPLEVRDWFIEDLKNNFEKTPRFLELKQSDLRQN